jgi:hypothetical protein
MKMNNYKDQLDIADRFYSNADNKKTIIKAVG